MSPTSPAAPPARRRASPPPAMPLGPDDIVRRLMIAFGTQRQNISGRIRIMQLKPTRRAVMAGIAGSALVDMSAFAQGALKLPTSPVTLNFVDVAGNLALTQAARSEERRVGEEGRSRWSPDH